MFLLSHVNLDIFRWSTIVSGQRRRTKCSHFRPWWRHVRRDCSHHSSWQIQGQIDGRWHTFGWRGFWWSNGDAFRSRIYAKAQERFCEKQERYFHQPTCFVSLAHGVWTSQAHSVQRKPGQVHKYIVRIFPQKLSKFCLLMFLASLLTASSKASTTTRQSHELDSKSCATICSARRSDRWKRRFATPSWTRRP